MSNRYYKTARIDSNLIEMIDILISDRRTGYKSRSEFIHDAIRMRIETLLSLYPDLKNKFDSSSVEK